MSWPGGGVKFGTELPPPAPNANRRPLASGLGLGIPRPAGDHAVTPDQVTLVLGFDLRRRQCVLRGLLILQRFDDVALRCARRERLDVVGVVRGGVRVVGVGMPMNFVPSPLRHDWKIPSAPKNFVVGSSFASGTVSPLAVVAPGVPAAPRAATVRTGPSLVIFHPGGSLMSA